MGWLQRLFGQEIPDQVKTTRGSTIQDQEMGPGLTGQYDWNLREKAGLHQPPLPPEQLGLEGEFDENGLAKRVALAFDQSSKLQALNTVTLKQDGSTILLEGVVPDHETLAHMIEIASKVDGTKSVDTRRIVVANPRTENNSIYR